MGYLCCSGYRLEESGELGDISAFMHRHDLAIV
jgi:hypothetical protein